MAIEVEISPCRDLFPEGQEERKALIPLSQHFALLIFSPDIFRKQTFRTG
jgi:hypothetical protein